MKKQDENQFLETAQKVSFVSITANVLLAIGKLIAGILASSGAMLSDAVHSFSDVFSTIVVLIGLAFSSKSADDDHPYGHERLECVTAILLSVVLLLSGLMIGYSGLQLILSGDYKEKTLPGALALAAAAVSILVKEGMYHYTAHFARKIKSGSLMADAWHHRSDALSSVGAFIGIFFARMGYPIMDPLASVIICLFIIKAAYDIFKDAMDQMVDKACPDSFTSQIRDLVLADPDVKAIDLLQTRMFANKIYIDLEIQVDGSLPLEEAHAIAQRVHDSVEGAFSDVKHIMIHLNPVMSSDMECA